MKITWNKFKKLINNDLKDGWIFRGTIDDWGLKTTLERYCKASGIKQEDQAGVEYELIREIQRKAYLISDISIPPDPDMLWWVSLMQHHGAPTRLLDWTYSPYIAAYFAFEKKFKLLVDKEDDESEVVVMALNAKRINVERESNNRTDDISYIKRILKDIKNSKPHILDFLFEKAEKCNFSPFVLEVNPYHLNKRLSIQQGIFLMQTNISKNFEENLKNTIGNLKNKENIMKFVITNTSKKNVLKILESLYRMNINHTSLFPGFDGFAQSLQTRIKFLSTLIKKR
ncbi:MAG: FRG domain-containing protein [Syntrophorhabdaceae bacterium]|nr:FRG domain-containing protein [Syntrophorhabdaceae bacterium]